MSTNRRCPLAIFAIGVIAISARAAADEDAFQQHFDAGNKAYEAARVARKFGEEDRATVNYRLAIEEYRLAYAAAPHGKALYSAAQAHRALGELEAALHLYDQYLRGEDAVDPYA